MDLLLPVCGLLSAEAVVVADGGRGAITATHHLGQLVISQLVVVLCHVLLLRCDRGRQQQVRRARLQLGLRSRSSATSPFWAVARAGTSRGRGIVVVIPPVAIT